MIELLTVMSSVSRVHISLYADEMSYSGIITPIQKAGIQKREHSNILHCI